MTAQNCLFVKLSRLLSILALAFAGATHGADTTAVTMNKAIETFFSGVKADFDKTASSPASKGHKVQAVNAYFFKTLKRHQPFYSLIKTDAKGMTVNEVVRVEGPVNEKRSLADQPWFKTVSAQHEEYTGFLKEDNGRYYMFWAVPLFSKQKGGKEKFLGAVAAKVDIWDCFQKFAKSAKTPFQIKLSHKTLYDHEWKNDIAFAEEPLSIAGVENISVCFPRAAGAAATVKPAADSVAVQQARADSIKAAKIAALNKAALERKAQSKHRAIIGIAIFIAIFVIFVIYWIVASARQRKLMKQAGDDQKRF